MPQQDDLRFQLRPRLKRRDRDVDDQTYCNQPKERAVRPPEAAANAAKATRISTADGREDTSIDAPSNARGIQTPISHFAMRNRLLQVGMHALLASISMLRELLSECVVLSEGKKWRERNA
jgi:hypothetical protein